MTTTTHSPIRTLGELRIRNAEAGHHWFDPDAVAIFHSTVTALFTHPDGGAVVVEKQHDTTGTVSVLGERYFDHGGKPVFRAVRFTRAGTLESVGWWRGRGGDAVRDARALGANV